MLAAELDLTEQERLALQDISQRTGKSENQLIREAIAQLIARFQSNARLTSLRQARGIWKDRHDLPTFDDLRSEWERF